MEQIHSSETKTLNYYRNSLRSRNLQLVRQINPLPILQHDFLKILFIIDVQLLRLGFYNGFIPSRFPAEGKSSIENISEKYVQ
jgi:hypothetical protein